MPSYSKHEVILVRYPFSALSGGKVRPAIMVNAPHGSQDVFIVPLTSRTTALLAGEFVLAEWVAAGSTCSRW
jgi:mRNA interferase MazF